MKFIFVWNGIRIERCGVGEGCTASFWSVLIQVLALGRWKKVG